jgi:hypothetical protein
MKRVLVSVALLAFAAWMCVVGRPSAASDDPLTPAMKKQIDASLVVFVGEVVESRGQSSEPLISYKVERYLKGTCFEPDLDVRHFAPPADSALLTTGSRVVVGAQLWLLETATYALRCKTEQLGASAWTQALEDSIVRHVATAPRGPTLPGAASARPDVKAMKQRLACMEHLSQLGQTYLMQAQESRAKAQKYSGPAMWLAMRKNAIDVRRGDEAVLLCPADPAAHAPQTDAERKAWDEVDLRSPAPGLCSYVGRDFAAFPIDPAGAAKEPIGACLHHTGGAVVVFESGDAQFVSIADLGLASDAEKTVGPDSKSPLLRKLR